MLQTGAVEGEDRLQRALDTIERNARVQTQLVEDILDVSRIIAGKLRVNIQKTDLHAVARSALERRVRNILSGAYPSSPLTSRLRGAVILGTLVAASARSAPISFGGLGPGSRTSDSPRRSAAR